MVEERIVGKSEIMPVENNDAFKGSKRLGGSGLTSWAEGQRYAL